MIGNQERRATIRLDGKGNPMGPREVVFRYLVEDATGAPREAVLRVPSWLAEPPELRAHTPVISLVEHAGTPLTDGDTLPPVAQREAVELRLRVAPEPREDGAPDAEQVWFFFATAGRVVPERAAGEEVTVTWRPKKTERGVTAAELYALVVDPSGGGQALAGPFRVPIRRDPT